MRSSSSYGQKNGKEGANKGKGAPRLEEGKHRRIGTKGRKTGTERT